MDQITQEEITAGTKPTRAELIAYTPLEEVLAKSSWDDVDLEILVNNRFQLDAETLAKIGVTRIDPLSAEEVSEQNQLLRETELQKTGQMINVDGVPAELEVEVTSELESIETVEVEVVETLESDPEITIGAPVDNEATKIK